MLAWIRTGLTLIAGGVAVAFISTDTRYGTIAGIGAILFSGLLALVGYIRYDMADRAIRQGALPTTGIGGLLVAVGVVIFAALLVIVKNFGA